MGVRKTRCVGVSSHLCHWDATNLGIKGSVGKGSSWKEIEIILGCVYE